MGLRLRILGPRELDQRDRDKKQSIMLQYGQQAVLEEYDPAQDKWNEVNVGAF